MADQPSNRRANDSFESFASIDSSSTTPSPHAIVEGPSAEASLQSVTIATPSTVSSSSASSSSPSPGQTTSQAIPSTALISVGQSQEISGQKHEPPASSPGSSPTALGKETGAISKRREPVSDEGTQSPPKRRSLSTKSSTADSYPLSLSRGREKSTLGRKSERSSSESDLPGVSPEKPPESPTYDVRPALELGATAAEAAAELGAAEGAAPKKEYDDEEDKGLRMISSPQSSSSTLHDEIKITEIKTDFPQYWKILYEKNPPEKTEKDRKPEEGKFFFPVPDEEVMGRAQSRIMVDNIYIKRDLKLNGIQFTTLWDEDNSVNISLNIFKESFIAASVPAPQLPQVGSMSTGRVSTTFSEKPVCVLHMNSAYMDIITYYMYYFLPKPQKQNPDMRPLTIPTPGEMMIYANHDTMEFYRVKWNEKGAAEFKTAVEIAIGQTKLVKESVEILDPDDVFEEEDSRKAEEEKEVEGDDDSDSLNSDDDSESINSDDVSDSLNRDDVSDSLNRDDVSDSLNRDDDSDSDEFKLPVECVDYCLEFPAEVVNLYEFVGSDLLPLKSIPPQGLKVTVSKINNNEHNIYGHLHKRLGKLVRVTTAEGIEGQLTRVILHDA